MKKITKIILATLIAIFAITLTNSVQANYQIIYQSVANNYCKTGLANYMNTMRNMEASGQVMGLSETHNGTSLLSDSGSNYLDIHLQKNTEYGAMILLAVSSKYGKQGEGTTRYITNGSGMPTTTGNIYGVYMNELIGNNGGDYVAATGNKRYYGGALNVTMNSRYVNFYETNNTSFKGDALINWQNGSLNFSYTSGSTTRGNYGSVFSSYYTGDATRNDSSYARYARPAIVCGEGF